MMKNRQDKEYIKIKYRHFPDIKITVPYDWSTEPYPNKNWLHNFYSLRWLNTYMSKWNENNKIGTNPILIFIDFLNYHKKDKTDKNNYYMTRSADHTISTRLKILTGIWKYKKSNHPDYRIINELDLKNEINKHISAMLSKQIYRLKHNHGFMMDMALIEFSLQFPDFHTDNIISIAENRIINQMDAMFDNYGFTYEHSISYQEYNASLCIDLLNIYKKYKRETNLLGKINSIIATTYGFLKLSTKPNGEYHKIGDTFTFPNKRLLEKIHNEYRLIPEKLRKEREDFFKDDDYLFFCPKAGFSIFKYSYEKNKSNNIFHLFFTASWHSGAHKQNDDLSFSLYADGVSIIEDPGYSDVVSNVDTPYRSENLHNVSTDLNESWNDATYGDFATTLTRFQQSNNYYCIQGVHSRIKDILVERTLIYHIDGILFIIDNFKVIGERTRLIKNRFNFGNGVDNIVKYNKGKINFSVGLNEKSLYQINNSILEDINIQDSYTLNKDGSKIITKSVEFTNKIEDDTTVYTIVNLTKQQHNNLNIIRDTSSELRILINKEEDSIQLKEISKVPYLNKEMNGIDNEKGSSIMEILNKSHNSHHVISDERGNQLQYRLNLQKNPKGLPLLVVLHGHGASATRFKHEGWNVLAPLDNFGYKNNGSWWLGEKGNFFLYNLLQKLIKEVSKKYDSQDNIYFYGSCMGGYGAILHGILSNAKAVYANIPQILLDGSTYFNIHIKKIDQVFDRKNVIPIENNLIDILEKYKNQTLPTFFICENAIESSEAAYKNYLNEHGMKFAQYCLNNKLKIHLELLPQAGHTKNYGLKEVLEKFNKFAKPLENRKICCFQDKFNLNSNNWFVKNNTTRKVSFENNSINLKLHFMKGSDPFYLISGDPSTSSIKENSKTYDISDCNKFLFEISVVFLGKFDFKFYILQFDDNGRVDNKSFKLKNGKNKIVYKKVNKAKYIKVAFRVHTDIEKNISIEINQFFFGKESKKQTSLDFEVYDYGKNNNINNFNSIIKYNQYLQHKMQVDKFKIDILSHYKKDCDKLIVFFNSAVNVEKTPTPVFQRWSWLEKLPYSVLIISDPTISELQKKYNEKILTGWYQGEANNFILESILVQIKIITNKLNISNGNIVFYGSSAGGFAALHAVNIIKASKACVVNPQTNIMEANIQRRDMLLKYLNLEKSTNNINIISLLKNKEKLPQVYYKQNKLDTLHYEKHYLPLNKIYEKSKSSENLYSVIIEDDRGHSAIPSFDEAKEDIEKTFEIFSPVLNENSEMKELMSKNTLDINLFILVNNKSTLDSFIPRKDTLAYKLIFPLDWSVNPYKDRNWCYQLHAWRMLDHRFFQYEKDKNILNLIDCLVILEDWERYTIFENKETDMTWNDMATGLRALKLAYLINRLFRKQTIHLISESAKLMLIRQAKKHIEELNNQKISLTNHGIFQVHGLIVLAWLFSDKESIDYGLEHMNNLINQQFYPEGFHTENSDDYHWFIYKTFNNIMIFDPYKSDSGIQKIMQRANSCKVWTVFPNNQSLLIGDSSDSIRKVVNKPLDDKNKIIIKHFKDSGYLFIRSTFQTTAEKSSMLFLQTSYKNRTHRHADDFNVLLYEYGMNILVDSGKYAYENNNNNRKYAISTRAHNCIVIDNKDYEFKGRETYESALEYAKYKDSIYKIKTSINRKKIGVIHNRNIIYKPKEFLIVIDMLESKKERNYDQCWHFHQDLELLNENKIISTSINDSTFMIIEPTIVNLDKFNTKLDNDILNIKLVKGQVSPELQGWRSLKYKEMIKNYALQNSIKAKKALLITKFIFVDKNSKKNDLDIIINKDKGEVLCNLISESLTINSKIIL